MQILTAAERPDTLVTTLLGIWEASVRVTHDFLTEDYIQSITPLVEAGLREIPSLTVITGEDGIPLGFMGFEGQKIEMLFIRPEARGQGLGRRMVEYGVDTLGIHCVDVNEQNAQGVGFYIRLGFEVIQHSPVDGQGNPFPILHMRLRHEDPDTPVGYSIRHAEPQHIPFLKNIEQAAAAIFPPGSLPEHIASECLPSDILDAAMKKARLWVALHEKDQVPVGYALLQIRAGSALLAQLDVLPDHGRKGVGTALVRRVLRAVRGMALPELYLTTFSNVPWNAPFYEKLGFHTLTQKEQPDFIQNILRMEQENGLEHRVAMRFSFDRLHIRALRPDEAFLLREFTCNAIYRDLGSEPLAPHVINSPELAVYYENFGCQHDFGVLAELEGKPVGAAWSRILSDPVRGYGNIDPDTPELGVSVLPGFRNLGLGTAMLESLFMILDKQGYTKVSLSVDKRNPAINLYRKLGFTLLRENDADLIFVRKLKA